MTEKSIIAGCQVGAGWGEQHAGVPCSSSPPGGLEGGLLLLRVSQSAAMVPPEHLPGLGLSLVWWWCLVLREALS